MADGCYNCRHPYHNMGIYGCNRINPFAHILVSWSLRYVIKFPIKLYQILELLLTF